MARLQLKHVLLDVNFKDKPKVLDLEDKFGPLGRLLYMDILASMSGATDGMITIGAMRIMANRIRFKQVDSIVKWLLEKDMILEIDGNYSNSRVIKDQESLSTKRDKNNERVMRYRSVTNEQNKRYPDTVSVSDTEYNNKNSQLEKKQIEPEPKKSIPKIPEKPLERWKLYLKGRHDRDFDDFQYEMAKKTALDHGLKTADLLGKVIDFSISTGAKNILWEKSKDFIIKPHPISRLPYKKPDPDGELLQPEQAKKILSNLTKKSSLGVENDQN